MLISKTTAASDAGVIIKSPTGSGKTIILLDYIDKYLSNSTKKVVFVWFCPGAGELEEQSRESMERYLPTRSALSLSDVLRQGFKPDDTVFINWEQVNKKNSIALTESEHKNLLEQIKNAHRNSIEFIIIVDEEHAYNTSKSKAIIAEFSATYTVRVSATAKPNAKYDWYEINEIDVIKEGLITKALYINEDIPNNILVDSEEEYLLGLADKKRKEIKNQYNSLNLDINPLVLIQFPDKSDDLVKKVVSILDSYGYNEKNGTVKYWFDKRKSKNLSQIVRNDDFTSFLLMKQAISTGWDCRRAKILVKLRENMSETFEIQTIGRIRRMPQAKHYGDTLLDNCYLFTFDSKYVQTVKQEIDSAFDVKHIRLKDKCKTLSLVKENKDEDREGLSGKEVFELLTNFYYDKYKLREPEINKTILEANGYVFYDEIVNESVTGKYILTSSLSEELLHIVTKTTVNTHKHGIDRRQTIDYLKSFIHTNYSTAVTVFKRLFMKDDEEGSVVSLPIKNYYAFIINNRSKLKEDLQELSMRGPTSQSQIKVKTTTFVLPDPDLFSFKPDINAIEIQSNAYDGYTDECFIDGIRSKPERLFERYCESNKNVDWVFKNGNKGKEYLSVVYVEGYSKQYLFYPDYIVCLKDGTIWIIETKGGESKSGTNQNIDPQIKNKFVLSNNILKSIM